MLFLTCTHTPRNERTTCAAARHTTIFIAQPKPRHSLPRQVRAVLRDGEPARLTLTTTNAELRQPNKMLPNVLWLLATNLPAYIPVAIR